MPPTKVQPADHVRVPIPAAAAAELRARFTASRAAEQRLTDFLSGVVLAAGVDPLRVTGFDDATCDLLLSPEANQDE